MFYHTDINDRILQIPGRGVQAKETKDNSLQVNKCHKLEVNKDCRSRLT